MINKLQKQYKDIIGAENLLEAWQEFLRGKRSKRDVQEFSLHLMDNILELNSELSNFSYKHGGYKAFNISDPKPRNIHKALVRDRLLHHAIYKILYPFFDKKFISDSFSCRNDKGTHKAINRFRIFAYTASKNDTQTLWVLKCDIRKFFANINHEILVKILERHIEDADILWLLKEVVYSFNSGIKGKGLPLGNLTSQLFVNIYMNEFDQFIKHKLKVKYYIRYADDFLIMSVDRPWLTELIPKISEFLKADLRLQLHPDKIFIKTLASGIDFLGWINFFGHRVLRTTTKRRMMRRIGEYPVSKTINSYLGLLGHGNTAKLIKNIYNLYNEYNVRHHHNRHGD